MVIRTMGFLADCPVQALLNLEIIRMEFLFLPSVAERAFVFKLATVFIWCNEVFRVPIGAHFLLVLEYRRFSPIVLPVMGIYAYVPLMVIFSIRTPHCLKMKDVKVHVRFKFLNELDWDFVLSMCERAKFSIFTILARLKIGRAEFSFVFVWMIELFDSVVRFLAVLSIRAVLMVFNKPTFFRLIEP
jgi:hypothetical protein